MPGGLIRPLLTHNQSAVLKAQSSGNQMRLIQFKGPIRPEWYQALVSTGVRVVTYIPNNAYLVYGSAERLHAVQQLAASNPAVQWEGEYTAAYRLDPGDHRRQGRTECRQPLGERQ